MSTRIRFLGAARQVTGSKHLLTTPQGSHILLDCGLFQGSDQEEISNDHLGFDPFLVDHVILSHAHIDHSGMLPLLAHQKYRGKIHATDATKDLCGIMLPDSAHIQEEEAESINKERVKQGLSEMDPIYTKADAYEALKLFETHPYDEWFELEPGVRVMFTVIGHILGSAAINIELDTPQGVHRICYTGDVGRPDHTIVKPPRSFPQADTIITEATYGDRLHPDVENSKEELLRIVEHTCVQKKGKLLIPAFSVGRTQEVVHELDRLEHEGRLPPIDTFVDSPLSTEATEVIRQHPECYNDELRNYMEKDEDPFGFKRLSYIRDVEDSIALNDREEPCIIISASGMMDAGRIKHHLIHTMFEPANTLLLIGYAEPHSLAGKLRAGNKKVNVFGKMRDVNMEIKVLDYYSAHGDRDEMIQYLSCQDPEQVQNLFLVHGNYEAQKSFKEQLLQKGFSHVRIPERKEEVRIA